MPIKRLLFSVGLLSLLTHAYLALRLLPFLPGPLALTAALYLAASAMLVPAGLLAGPLGWSDRLAWVGLLAMGLFSSLLVLTLGREVLLLLSSLITSVTPELARTSAQAVIVLALVASAAGLVNARRVAAVRRIDVPIAGLAPALHGYTIAQISDIHVGPTIKRGYLEAIVHKVNALEADCIAITGDLVDGSVARLAGHTAPLAQLRARDGTFFVTGIHEYYSGADAWVGHLRGMGLTVLANEHVLRVRGAAVIVIAGVNDFSAHPASSGGRSDPHKAMAGAPADAAVRILLAHQPRSAPGAAAAGFDLQLSGHTHGGQFFPWNLFVPLQQPFTAGLHRLQALWVYTSRGTGYWGPPKRFGAPSEITHLRLVPA